MFFVTTTICAYAIHHLEDSVNWGGAFVLGTLVSITDPIEGIKLLEKMHAKHKFITIVELESLINDGTGIIFFNFFASIIKEEHPTTPTFFNFTRALLWEGLGSILVGWIFKKFATSWLKIIHSDVVNSINVTVITTYMVFCIAENSLKVSGVLAVVTLGLSLSKVRKTLINDYTEKSLKIFWNYALFFSESIIFIACGIFIGHSL